MMEHGDLRANSDMIQASNVHINGSYDSIIGYLLQCER